MPLLRPRARDLGIAIGVGVPGPLNAITDVGGVLVGHATLISGDGPLVVGKGPVRTGVSVIRPHPDLIAEAPVFAGFHSTNGNGEMTGIHWLRESGLLGSPIALTNTHSLGAVHEGLVREEIAARSPDISSSACPSWRRRSTATSTTSTVSTSAPSTPAGRMPPRVEGPWRRGASAAAPA